MRKKIKVEPTTPQAPPIDGDEPFDIFAPFKTEKFVNNPKDELRKSNRIRKQLVNKNIDFLWELDFLVVIFILKNQRRAFVVENYADFSEQELADMINTWLIMIKESVKWGI